MGEPDWNSRYREGFNGGPGALAPHELVTKLWPAIPKGRVVDIAMGTGRDLSFLSKKGFDVYGIEKSAEAINIARSVLGEKAGLTRGNAEHLPLRHESVEGVLVFYFLLRSIMGDIAAILKRGGVVIYQTFLKRQNGIDRWRNPEYLLDDGELISFFLGGFDLLFYEETVSLEHGKKRAVAKLVGRKR